MRLHGLVPTLPDDRHGDRGSRRGRAAVRGRDGSDAAVERQLRPATGVLEPAGDLGKLADLAVPRRSPRSSQRLDALAPPDRALVLDAAVLGQSFSCRTRRGLRPCRVGARAASPVAHPARALSPTSSTCARPSAALRVRAGPSARSRTARSRGDDLAARLESLGDPELVAAVAGHYLAAVTLARPGEEAEELAVKARVAPGGGRPRGRSAPRPGEDVLRGGARPHDRPRRSGGAVDARRGEGPRVSRVRGRGRAPHLAVELRRTLGDRQALARASRSTRVCCSGPRGSTMWLLSSSPRSPSSPTSADPAVLPLRDQHARLVYLSGPPERAIELASPLDLAESSDQPAILASSLITIGVVDARPSR